MTSNIKYVGMDVHKESISVAIRNAAGKIVMECVIETKSNTILQFFDGLRGEVRVTFEEGTWAAWLYDLLKPHVTKLVVCDPRRNALLLKGNQNDRVDARKLSDLLYMNKLNAVYHGDHGLRTLKELGRTYLTVTRDQSRVMTRVKAMRRARSTRFGSGCVRFRRLVPFGRQNCWAFCRPHTGFVPSGSCGPIVVSV